MLPVWHLVESPSNKIAQQDPIACRANAPAEIQLRLCP